MKLNKFLIFFLFISFQSKFLFSLDVAIPGDRKSGMAERQRALDEAEGKSGMAEGLGEGEFEIPVKVMWVQPGDAKRPIAIPLEIAKLSTLLREGLTREKVSEKRPFPLPEINQIELGLFLKISKKLVAAKLSEDHNDLRQEKRLFNEIIELLIKLLNAREIELSAIYKLFNLEQYLEIPILKKFLFENIAKICAQYPPCLEHLLKDIKGSIIDLGPEEEGALKEKLSYKLLDLLIKISAPELIFERHFSSPPKKNIKLRNSTGRLEAIFDYQSNSIVIYQIGFKGRLQREQVFRNTLIGTFYGFKWVESNTLDVFMGNYIYTLKIPDKIPDLTMNQLLLILVLEELYLEGSKGLSLIEQNSEKILEILRNYDLPQKYYLIERYYLAKDIKRIKAEDAERDEARTARAALIYRLLHKGS